MDQLFWFIVIIVAASIIFPLCICGIVYLVVFVLLKKAYDSSQKYPTHGSFMVAQTIPSTTFSNQPNPPAQGFDNAAFDVEMNNQHQIHHQMHIDAHQKHIDIHNSVVNSHTTELPTYHIETVSSTIQNDFGADKNDTSTNFTSNDPI